MIQTPSLGVGVGRLPVAKRAGAVAALLAVGYTESASTSRLPKHTPAKATGVRATDDSGAAAYSAGRAEVRVYTSVV